MANTGNFQEWLNNYENWTKTTEVFDMGNVVVNRGSREPMSVEELLNEQDITDELMDTEVENMDLESLSQEFDSVINDSLNTVDSADIPEDIRADILDETWEDIPLNEEGELIGDLEGEVEGATELTELIGESSMEEFVEITYLAPELMASEAAVTEGIVSSIAVAAEAVAPVALLAAATYALTWAINDIQKNQAIEEDNQNQLDFIKRKSNAQTSAENATTINEKNNLMSDFYRQPNTYLYDPVRKKYIKSDEAIKRVDKYISGFNKHIKHLDNLYDLYNKWVINVSNPDVRNHPYKSMSPVQLNDIIHYKGNTIALHDKVKQYINDNYTLENSNIMARDPLMIDHMREQAYNDPLYEQEKANAYNSGKFKVNSLDEMDTMTPPFWSTYYKRNANRFMKQDMNKIKLSMKAYQARGGKPIIHRRKHTLTPDQRFNIMFGQGDLPGLMHIPQDEATITNRSHENRKRKRIHPTKEWHLETKDEEYDPNLSSHFNNLSNATFDYGTKYKNMNSLPQDNFGNYSIKEELGDRDGFLLYNQDDNNIIIVFEGTDYPATKHGLYKKFLKDLFTSLHSNMQSYNGDKFHAGYLQKYLSLKPQIEKFIKAHHIDNTNILLSGFSAGGALAQLGGYLLRKEDKYPIVSVYSYASPRVFAKHTSLSVNKILPHNYRINLKNDLIPYFPLKTQRENSYYHAGTEFLYDNTGNFRRYVGDIDVDGKYSLKDILRKGIKTWKIHTRNNYNKAIGQHLFKYNKLGSSIKQEIELLKDYNKLFSNTQSFSKVNDKVYASEASEMLYYPSYHRGQIYMNAIPKQWVQGIYLYHEGDFSNTEGNVLGFAIYR